MLSAIPIEAAGFRIHGLEDSEMGPTNATPIKAQLMQVGLEVFPVYGDEASGWSVDAVDLSPDHPHAYRYRSLDELFFALVNLNLSPEGQA